MNHRTASYDLYKNEVYLNAVNSCKSKVPNPFLVSIYIMLIKVVSVWTAYQVFTDI